MKRQSFFPSQNVKDFENWTCKSDRNRKKNVFLPSLQTKGPPESPWQASFSPSEYPAQIIEFVMFRKLKL